MPQEIEAKIKVDSFVPVRAKLEQAGAKFVGDFLETNVMFDTEDRTLLAADKGLRVRCARNLADKSERCTMTYKGPRAHSNMKSRPETEMGVGNFHSAIELLEQLKYIQVLSFEKRRQSWELGRCKVELDELPHLGCFVEIEGHSEQAIKDVQKALGLAERPIVKTAYVGLMMSYLQDKGASTRAVSFSTK
jgi:predicted adenylyl cyclase CyaB